MTVSPTAWRHVWAATCDVLDRRATLVAAMAALAACLLTMTSAPVGVFYDDAIYLLTAKALAEGHGYVYATIPGMPAAIHYPPLWPAILAVAWKIMPSFPENVAWFKLINPLFVAAAAAGTVVAGRRLLGFPWWLALAVALGSIITVPVLVLTNALLSEPLFLALLFPTILAHERMSTDRRAQWVVVAAVLAALMVLGRTISGVFVVAAVMILLLDRRWRDVAVYCLIVGLLLLPWQLLVWRVSPGFPEVLKGSYGPYLEWVVDGYRDGGWPFMRAVIEKNIESSWRMFSIFVSPLVRGPVRAMLTAAASVLLFGGLAILWRRRGLRITSLAFAGYIGVVIAWPFQVERFIWAVWPLLVLVVAGASFELVLALRQDGRRRAALAMLALAVVLGTGNLTYNIRGLSRGWATSASSDMADRALILVRYINADDRLNGKVIATEVAPMVALYTGRTVVPVQILTTEAHVDPTGRHADAAENIERIDAAFSPDAYVLMPDGPHLGGLLEAELDASRVVRDATPVGIPVRVFFVTSK